MKKLLGVIVCCVLAFGIFAGNRWMEEGMWLLDSIGKLPVEEMKKHGLELTPEQIYSTNGPSLKDAIVLLGGGTASFVSKEGLLITNHHVAFRGIQALSSVQDDYLKNGFWAKSHAEELSTTYSAQVLVGMRDVTADVLSAVSDTMSADARARAIQVRTAELEKAEKGVTDRTCRISDIFGGVKYYLFIYQAYPDVRLVYAPPSAIGNFGGEVDNWMWPRHTGDFSLMRVYTAPDGKPAKHAKENIPYTPKAFLPVSTKGYSEGSFAMIMGYPGRTFRYREASAVQLARDETLPTTIDLYKTRMDILEAAGQTSRALEIKFAGRLRGLANTYKNYLGTLEGMKRAELLTLKRNEELKFAAYVNSSAELSGKYGTLLADMERLANEQRTYNRKFVLFSNLSAGVDMFRLAARMRTYAGLFRDSVGTTIAPSQKERDAVRDFVGTVFRTFDLNVDRETLTALLLKNADMPVEQQLAIVKDIVGSRTGADREKHVRDYVADLYDETTLVTPAGCEKLLARGPDAVTDDEFVRFATTIDAEQSPVTQHNTKINAKLAALRGKFIEAWLDWKKDGMVYPDANRSIRFTYGTVKPYSPRDAVEYCYYTTLTGVIEKEQPEDPFIVPAKLKELWKRKDFGRYADAKTGEVHVAFLSDLDITGGNSGSPVINGKGELIGCAFDGNWEAVVGDYYFQEQFNRTISVDSRYVLFVLDKFSGAESILKELVIH
ncbi:MAG: S46 family peptidase [Bacteroidota bacterium]